MKKVLMLISEYFSRFFSVVFVASSLLLYSTYVSNPELWMGGGMSGNVFHDNFGSLFLANFYNNYFFFFFFPLIHFLIFFLVISLILWTRYRHDEKAGKIGFRNVVLSLLIAFLLIYFPLRIDVFKSKIDVLKANELASYEGTTKISSISERRDMLNLYHSLFLEGLISWRHDPIAVVENELKNGELRSLSGKSNELSIVTITDADQGVYGNAVVLLKTERQQAEIHLTSLGGVEDRVWAVYSYRVIKK